jgi:hypothetical protein
MPGNVVDEDGQLLDPITLEVIKEDQRLVIGGIHYNATSLETYLVHQEGGPRDAVGRQLTSQEVLVLLNATNGAVLLMHLQAYYPKAYMYRINGPREVTCPSCIFTELAAAQNDAPIYARFISERYPARFTVLEIVEVIVTNCYELDNYFPERVAGYYAIP